MRSTKEVHGAVGLLKPAHIPDQVALALLLSGSSQRRDALSRHLLAQVDGLQGLTRQGMQELRRLGMGAAEAMRLVAAMEVGRRCSAPAVVAAPIVAPQMAYACVAPVLVGANTERFIVVVLDVRNRPRCIAQVARGSVGS